MGTKIIITPPGGNPREIKVYDRCTVTLSATTRSGSFTLVLPDVSGELIDAFPVGSDVWISQGDHIFRGWVLNPAKSVDGPVKAIQIDGMCYTGRTQKIVVTENYENWRISDIVNDLFAKYMPWINRDSIVPCDKVITIRFRDEFLFDCMEKLCKLAGYEWFISEPLPEEIPQGEGSGWSELVELVPPALATDEGIGWEETVQQRIFYPPRPAEDLYPSETLYPG
jgi:hypothetical protein